MSGPKVAIVCTLRMCKILLIHFTNHKMNVILYIEEICF